MLLEGPVPLKGAAGLKMAAAVAEEEEEEEEYTPSEATMLRRPKNPHQRM